MSERKPLSISVDMSTDKLQLKLRAIAKHAEALANELEAIDTAWQCDCGATEYAESKLFDDDKRMVEGVRRCMGCGESYAILSDDDLPTRFEGSE